MAHDNLPDNPPSILVRNLTYTFANGVPGLQDINLDLPPGSRTLLIGANGAGKTTLLRLLSGRRLAPASTVLISGLDPFSAHLTGVTYLGLEWVLNPIVRSDIDVPSLLASVGGDAYPSRRDELVHILDIDLGWRLHAVSDGERRRVQLAMGLIRPWSVLLLDEVTVDLDLLTRRRFLDFLRRETEGVAAGGRARGPNKKTVVYATHVLDGLAAWPTHLVHMTFGRVKEVGEMNGLLKNSRGDNGGDTGNGSALADLALEWLREDFEERGPRNTSGDSNTNRSYESMTDGIGGYGYEKRPSWTKRDNDDG